MSQSIKGSWYEAWTNIFVGFGLNYILNWLVFGSLLHVNIPWTVNLEYGLVMTFVSLGRGFCLRRIFNGIKAHHVSDFKPTNPKDAIGQTKLDMGLVPDTLVIGAATAFLEGALKYGRFNWRISGVRASVYHAAIRRHLAKWWGGQDHDPDTKVHHLDNAIACLGIIRDAYVYGKLNDDRPPAPYRDLTADLIDSKVPVISHLKNLFKDNNPHQYTIIDTEPK